MKHKLGWIRDLPDHRDKVFNTGKPIAFPNSVDLRKIMPPVYDQGELGSCTANAIAGAFEADLIAEQKVPFTPSRLFIYFNERAIENTWATDSGAQIRDGMKTVAKQGVCDEIIWPYEINKFADCPSKEAYSTALNHTSLTYARIPLDLKAIKTVLAYGYPIIFGFSVFDSFESEQVAQTGQVQVPGIDESMLGGHAVVAVGYNDADQTVTVRNSWGPNWGDGGYCYFPYEYFRPGLVSDLWALKTVL